MTIVSSDWSTTVPFVMRGIGNAYSETTKLAPGGLVAEDTFGVSTALSADGTVMLVGATGDDTKASAAGAVYHYAKVGGVWSLVGKITASDAVTVDGFGSSVALNSDGTYALIGALGRDDKGADSGCVYTFTRNGSVWTQTGKFYSDDCSSGAVFGVGVSMTADASYCVVGAHGDARFGAASGTAYVFRNVNGTWVQHQKLYVKDAVAGMKYGISASMSRDGVFIAVGAYLASSAGTNAGAVYIYKKLDEFWVEQARITPSGCLAGEMSGLGVALDETGDTLLINAYADGSKGANTGSMYFFTRKDSRWIQKQKFTGGDTVAGDTFGRGVAVSADGNTVAVGSENNDARATNSGAVYVYDKITAKYTCTQKTYASDATASLSFAEGIAISGDGMIALVGAPLDDTKAANAGVIYVFVRLGNNWVHQQKIYASDAASGDYFGASAALNSDGTYALIGAYADDDKGSDAGSVYAFARTGNAWVQQQKILAADGVAGAWFGVSVALNADATIALIGAHGDDTKGTDAGAVYVFTRTGAVWTQQSKFYASDSSATDYFGLSVSISADATYALIGAYGDDDKATDAGSVYVFTRSGAVWTQQQKLYATDFAANDCFGISVSLNADASVAIIGAYSDADKGTDTGSIYVFTRSGSVWSQQSKLYSSSPMTGQKFGRSLSMASSEGIFLVGTPSDDIKANDAGAFYTFVDPSKFTIGESVVFADTTGYTQEQKIFANDAAASDAFGASVAFNADATYAIVGAHKDDDKVTDSGAAYVFTRTGSAWAQQTKLYASDAATVDYFGFSAALNADATIALIGACVRDDKGTDSGAVYVFTRTGAVWAQQQKILAADGVAGDWFGASVALNADATYALIASHGRDEKGTDTGTVYVFTRSGSVYTQQTKLYAPDPHANDLFGRSVALSADAAYAAIGAYNDNDKVTGGGSVYIFTRNGTVWTYQTKLYAADAAVNDMFGISCALNSDASYLYVGAHARDEKGTDSGALYIFTRNGAAWAQQIKLFASDAATGDQFGLSVAVSADGSYLGVGAPCRDEKATDAGTVYMFKNPALAKTEQYVQTKKIFASDAAASDVFGNSVALSTDGQYMLVGSQKDDDKATDAGSVYVFKYVTGAWVQQTKLVSSDGTVNDYFGLSIAVNADATIALIGSWSDEKASNAGAVYVFTRSGDVWSQQQKLFASNFAIDDFFGISVALNSDATIALIGANGNDDKATDAGSVYVFTRSGTVWTQQQKLYATDFAANDYFGYGLALNSDATYALIGARGDDDKATDAGSVYVFTRIGAVWTQQTKLYAINLAAGDAFGSSVALTADASVAFIGSHGDEQYGSDTGTVYVFVRTDAVWTQKAKLKSTDALPGDNFGRSVAASIDGTRLVIGASGRDDKAAEAGCVYEFTKMRVKNAPSYVQDQKFYAPDATADDHFGVRISVSGDGNYAMVGAFRDDDKGVDSGSVYVYIRAGSTWAFQQKLLAADGVAYDYFGIGVALNADATYAAIGAQGRDDKVDAAGCVYVYTRSGTTWSLQTKLYASDFSGNQAFGYSTALNADATYLLVGAFLGDGKAADSGDVYVFTRSGTTWTQQTKLTASDGKAGDWFGDGVALNADGTYALISAHMVDDIGTNTGAVYVFTRSGTTWTQQQKFYAQGSVAEDGFGFSIAVNSDATVALFTDNVSDKGANAGAVYVFTRAGDTWIQQYKFYASDAAAGSHFGIAVGMSGDGSVVLVGANNDPTKGTKAGALYSFKDSSLVERAKKLPGLIERSKFYAPDAVASDKFGTSLALSADGSYALVGSQSDDDKASDSGSVYVFVRDKASWTFQTKLFGYDSIANDYFGYGVALNADASYALVGAVADDDKALDAGCVYVYTRAGDVWTVQTKLYASDAASSDCFGGSVALNADATYALIGAYGDDDKGTDSGSVYVFTRTGETWVQQMKLTASDGAASDAFGQSVALNADATISFIGASTGNSAVADSGCVYVFTRSGSAWMQQQKLVASDAATNDYFGVAVALNSDATVALIGASGTDTLGSMSGSCYLFTRIGMIWTEQKKIYASDIAANDLFGRSVALTADGSIALIGAQYDPEKATQAGSVYFFASDALDYASTNQAEIIQRQKIWPPAKVSAGYFGMSVVVSGDQSRMLVGEAYFASAGLSNAGRVHSYKKVNGNWALESSFYPADVAASDFFGKAIAISYDGKYALVTSYADDDKATDAGSAYAYTCTNGVWAQTQKFTAPDGTASDDFGYSVSMSGDGSVAIVGAVTEDDKATDNGAAYVYVRGNGVWKYQQKLTPPDNATASFLFGSSASVSNDGNYIAIGAMATTGILGCAYVYVRVGQMFYPQQQVTPPIRNTGDLFGGSVGLNGDGSVLAVGAFYTAMRGARTGCVYLFTRVNGTWTYRRTVLPNEVLAGDCFGSYLSLSPDGKSIVTSSYSDADFGTNAGAVYVLDNKLKASDVALPVGFSPLYKFNPFDVQASDYVGRSVAISGDGKYAIVGGPGDDDKGSNVGAAYVYYLSGGVWVLQQKIYAVAVAADDSFAVSVALNYDGSVAVIGEHSDNTKGTDTGSVFIFNRVGSTWTQVLKIYAPDPVVSDQFGHSVDISGDGKFMLVGALGSDTKASNAGAVYVFESLGMDWVYRQKLYASDAAADDYFGASLALNNDATIAVIGAHGRDDKGAMSGAVYVFTRLGTVWTQQSKVYATGAVANDYFGIAVALSSDATTLLVGAHGADSAVTDSGAAYVFKAPALPKVEQFGQTQALYASDATASDNFGCSCAISGDGQIALAGAQLDDDKAADAGSVYVFVRSAGAWVQQQKLYAADFAANDYFGISVALNIDGTYALIGAHCDDDKAPGAGAVYVFTRSGTVWTQEQKFYATDFAANDYFGASVALNADATYAVIGAYSDDDKATDAGSAYVFTRNGSVWTQQAKLLASDGLTVDYFGASVALNADASYVLVGTGASDAKGVDSGAVYVFTRSGTTWTQEQKIVAPDGVASDLFGTSVALNPDATLALIGAPGDDDKADAAGSIYMFTRSGSVWTLQTKVYSGTPVANQNFGRSISVGSDGLTFLAGMPADDTKATDAGVIQEYKKLLVPQIPVYAQTQKLFAPDAQPSDEFGVSLSLTADGSYALIGADGDDDRVATGGAIYAFATEGYNFVINNDAEYKQKQKVLPSVSGRASLFGRAVAYSRDGNYMAVGEPDRVTSGYAIAGAVSVYAKVNGIWTYQSEVLPSDQAAGKAFGLATALNQDGTLMMVGGYIDDTKATDSGSVYVFTRNGAVWTQVQKFYASDAATSDCFGASIAINADATIAFIGSHQDDDLATESGSVYVFVRGNAPGSWRQQQKIVMADSVVNQFFSTGVATDSTGNYLLVGLYGVGLTGRVDVYYRNGTAWLKQAELTVPGPVTTTYGMIAASLSLSGNGDVAVLGMQSSNEFGTNSGCAYIYTRNGAVWSFRRRVYGADVAAGVGFGCGTAIVGDGSEFASGASFDNESGTNAGAVSVFNNFMKPTDIPNSSDYVQYSKFTAFDGVALDNFGAAVAISANGLIALVGANGDDDKGDGAGAIYVFTRESASSIWVLQQKLYASDATAGDNFGIGVALNADASLAFVGAYCDDDKASNAGSVYVFARIGTTWAQQQKLFASDGVANDYFGMSVATNAAGDYLLVGAMGSDTKTSDAGCAYVLTRVGTAWTQQIKLYASDFAVSDQFGRSVALNADATVALVGTWLSDTKATDAGSVYVFTRVGTTWTQRAKLYSSDPYANDYFGVSASIDAAATTVVIGSLGRNDKGTGSGIAYVYKNAATAADPVFVQVQKLYASDITAGDSLGVSVAINADASFVFIGSNSDDDKGSASGSVYFFSKESAHTFDIASPTDVVQTSKMLPQVAGKAGAFGCAVSYSQDGNFMAVGEHIKTTGSYTNAGAVSIYNKVNGVWTFHSEVTPSDQATGKQFGISLALDSDGTLLLAGAYRDATQATDAGSVYVFTRSGSVWTQQQKLYASDAAAYDYFGLGLAMTPNGKIAFIASPADDDLATDSGSVYVFVRGNAPRSWRQQQKIVLGDIVVNSAFGHGIATDASGDYLLVGKSVAPGKVYVFYRSDTTWIRQGELLPPAPDSALSFGCSCSMNADGTIAVVGAHEANELGARAGMAYIYTRNGAVWSFRKRVVSRDVVAGDLFSRSVALSALGTELAIGSYADNESGTAAGSLSLFSNTIKGSDIQNPTDYIQYSKLVAFDGYSGQDFGISVALNIDATYALIGMDGDDTKVTDGGAVYVFTREPQSSIWVFQQKLFQSDPVASDYFGSAVAISDDATHALISSSYDDDKASNSGCVYYFTRVGTVWTQQAKLYASDPVAGDLFGSSLALNGDATIAAIGANGSDSKASDGGCVYMFTRAGSLWTQQQKIVASDGVVSDAFGFSAALSSDGLYMLVGCHLKDDKGADSGVVYVYTRSGTVWTYQTKLYARDELANDYFGVSVSVNSDASVAIVGAHGDDDKALNSGGVYVFNRTGTVWTQVQKLCANDAFAQDAVGRSVAISRDGKFIVIDSSGDDDKGSISGSLYLYSKESLHAFNPVAQTGIVQTKKILPPVIGQSSYFGRAVAVSQDNSYMIVGESGLDVAGVVDAGAAHVYVKTAGEWVFQQTLTASDKATYDNFGNGVAINGDGTVAVVGAYGDDDKGSESGSVYVFTRVGTVWTQEQKIVAADGAATDYFGFSVAISSDGTYVVVGATADDDRATDAGSLYVYTRANSLWTLQTKLTDPNGKASEGYGNAITINSDGTYIACVAAGVTNTGYGNASVWKRLGTSWTMQQRIAIPGLAINSSGRSVNGVALNAAADMLAIGILNDNVLGNVSGVTMLYTRRGGTWTYRRTIRASDEVTSTLFGESCGMDATGDTIYVGAIGDSEAGATSGAVYQFANTLKATDIALPVGLSQVEKLDVPGTVASDGAGVSTAISGDGLTMFVGIFNKDTLGTNTGGVAWYSRISGSSTWIYQSMIYPSDPVASLYFGYSVALNFDGSMALVGSHGDDTKAVDAGTVYVFTRSGVTWTQQQKLYAPDAAAGDVFGGSCCLNADASYAIVGAYADDDTASNTGSAYVFTRSGSVWTLQQKIVASDAIAEDLFGCSCAINGDATIAFIGARGDDDKASAAGTVYVFTRTGSLWSLLVKLNASDALANADFGNSCATNVDGSKVLIGGPVNNDSVYVFKRSGNNWVEDSRIYSLSNSTGDAFGIGCGLSADGSLAVIGACYDDETYTDQGSVYVFADLAVHPEFI